jgi:hypothetical protein
MTKETGLGKSSALKLSHSMVSVPGAARTEPETGEVAVVVGSVLDAAAHQPHPQGRPSLRNQTRSIPETPTSRVDPAQEAPPAPLLPGSVVRRMTSAASLRTHLLYSSQRDRVPRGKAPRVGN